MSVSLRFVEKSSLLTVLAFLSMADVCSTNGNDMATTFGKGLFAVFHADGKQQNRA